MAKKILPKAQPGRTMSAVQEQQAIAQMRANVNAANQAALENVRRPPVKQLSMDELYAGSAAAADSTYKSNLKAYKSKVEALKLKKEQERVNAERARLIDAMTTPNKKAGGAITDMGKVQAYYKNKR